MSRLSRRATTDTAPTVTYQTAELCELPLTRCVISADNKRVTRHQFRDLAELTKAFPATAPETRLEDTPWATRRDMVEFTGITDMGAALKLATEGWHDGARKAQDAAARLEIERPTKQRLSRQCQVAGALPDVARAIAGNPAHMRQIKPREVAGKIITLTVDLCVSSRIPQERLMLNAVCAAAVVDALEGAGFRVEVVARATSGGDAFVADTAIIAKGAGDPLDLGKLVFICGHPAMLRRLIFGLWCSDASLSELRAGLGMPHVSIPDPENGFFVIPSAQGANETEKHDVTKIFDGVVAALREQGCPGLSE